MFGNTWVHICQVFVLAARSLEEVLFLSTQKCYVAPVLKICVEAAIKPALDYVIGPYI